MKRLMFIFALCFIFSQTACMQTRSQIKNGEAKAEERDDNEGENHPQTQHHSYENEEIKSELTRLRGKVEEVDLATKQVNTSELKENVSRLENRVGEIEKNQLLILSEIKALKDEKETQTRTAAMSSGDLFKAGKDLMKQGKFAEAFEKFQGVVNKSPKGKEAADAYFAMGETQYAQKDYKKAIVQYSKVQEAYSKSARVPTSLYKIGMAFQHLNMHKEASGFFSELIERFPKSVEAKKARSKVKE
jgi:tol-pal system protein YbgF